MGRKSDSQFSNALDSVSVIRWASSGGRIKAEASVEYSRRAGRSNSSRQQRGCRSRSAMVVFPCRIPLLGCIVPELWWRKKSLSETVMPMAIRSHVVDAPLVALETLALALVRLLEELLLKAVSSV